jgi:hypothetical protein
LVGRLALRLLLNKLHLDITQVFKFLLFDCLFRFNSLNLPYLRVLYITLLRLVKLHQTFLTILLLDCHFLSSFALLLLLSSLGFTDLSLCLLWLFLGAQIEPFFTFLNILIDLFDFLFMLGLELQILIFGLLCLLV